MGGKSTAEHWGEMGKMADWSRLLQAQELYDRTKPVREQFLSQWSKMGQGEMPFGQTAFPEMLKAAKGPIEQQYDVARQNIMESIPQGGRLDEALMGVETARAQGLQDVVADYLMDQINKMYGTAWGTPQMSISGMQGIGQGGAQSRIAMSQAAAQGASSCCFNFLEAEGEIHAAVRRYRDDHFSKDGPVGRGYYFTARYFVPWMRKYLPFKRFIQYSMTKPLRAYAQWYYDQNRYGFLFCPFAKAWVNFWRLLGKGTK